MKSILLQNQRITYFESQASPGPDGTVIFVHGTPTHSGEYQETFGLLPHSLHAIAIDHLGFGGSDKPVGGDYSIKAHQERLNQSLKALGIQRIHLVVHDFGGVIGLSLLQDPDFEIRSLTLMNTWLWPLLETEPQIKTQTIAVRLGLLPFLYRQFNFSARVLLPMAWGHRKPLTPERHLSYMRQFPTSKDREGCVAFLRELFAFDSKVWKSDLGRLKDLKIPIQIIWGKADKLLSERCLERLRTIFPQAKVQVLDDVGHFVAEEASDVLSAVVQQQVQKSKVGNPVEK